MTSYLIPHLGSILNFDELPAVRFSVAGYMRYSLARDMAAVPAVTLQPVVVTRAEMMVNRFDLAFAQGGATRLEAEETAYAEEMRAYAEALDALHNAAEPEVTEPEVVEPVRRGRGRPAKVVAVEPEPEEEVYEDDADDSDDEELDYSGLRHPSDMSVVTFILEEATSEDMRTIALPQSAPFLDMVANNERAGAVLNNNLGKLAAAYASYGRAVDTMQQADPSNIDPSAFLQQLTPDIEDLDIDTRRVDALGLQTHQQKLRGAVDSAQKTYYTILDWFEAKVIAPAVDTAEYVTLTPSYEFAGIEINLKTVMDNFFTEEFIEIK